MGRKATLGAVGRVLVGGAILLGTTQATAAEPSDVGDRVEPPSEYVEDIETPAQTGGVEDEVDAGDAEAEAAPAGAPAEPKQAAAAIAVDLIINRPTMLMATVAGSAFFVLSLPITAPSGMYDESLERFIEEPGKLLIGPLGK